MFRLPVTFALLAALAAAPALAVTPAKASAKPAAAAANPALRNPAAANAKAPDLYKVRFKTSKGNVVFEVHRDWSPAGADRFYNLVKIGYFKDIAFFRAVSGFMVQFGIHGDPEMNKVWRAATIPDDPMGKASNSRGMLTFAKTGMPNSRSVQFFVNYGNNANLDRMGFTPIGKVVEGLESTIDKINTEYGEGQPRGRGPDQGRLQMEGNAYLKAEYPRMDYILSAELVP